MGCKFESCPGSQFFPFESIRNRTRGLLAQEPLTVTKMQRGVFSLQMLFFFPSRRRHPIFDCDWSSDVCSSDLFGAPGRAAVEERLPGLKEELGAGFCIVNAENVADGAGITPRLADRLLAAGADILTLGNHVWRRADIADYLSSSRRVIRPANLSAHAPGRGLAVATARDGAPVAVVNLLGALFIGPPVGPFEVVDALVETARAQAPTIVVDFHAEATSEK